MHYLHKLILPVPAILGYIFAVKDLPQENAGIFFFFFKIKKGKLTLPRLKRRKLGA